MKTPSSSQDTLAAGGRLLVASRNPAKRAEMLRLLHAAPIELCSLADFPHVGPVPETGASFQANARLKAEGFFAATALPAVADDSGLEVDALGGAPGVYSARYAGVHGQDAANVAKLLEALADVPPEARAAAFRCCIAVADARGVLTTIEGTCRGRIAETARGAAGFGYDPVFIPEAGDGRTMAELSAAEKDALSHRGAALRRFAVWLKRQLG